MSFDTSCNQLFNDSLTRLRQISPVDGRINYTKIRLTLLRL